MRIEMNAIYHLPTQAHEDDFLKQADKQEIKWISATGATQLKKWNFYKEEYCICVKPRGMEYADKPFYETDKFFSSLPIIEWKIGFSKADMQIGQIYKDRCGNFHPWREDDVRYYADDLTWSYAGLFGDNDIIEVYPLALTPIWKRPEPKYRVKTELAKEQAEKLGLEFCEVVE